MSCLTRVCNPYTNIIWMILLYYPLYYLVLIIIIIIFIQSSCILYKNTLGVQNIRNYTCSKKVNLHMIGYTKWRKLDCCHSLWIHNMILFSITHMTLACIFFSNDVTIFSYLFMVFTINYLFFFTVYAWQPPSTQCLQSVHRTRYLTGLILWQNACTGTCARSRNISTNSVTWRTRIRVPMTHLTL